MQTIIMSIFIPIYIVLDNLILIDIFGCGCVPSTQTNMLNIPFNANIPRILYGFSSINYYASGLYSY